MITSSRFQGLDTLFIDTPLARCEIALFGAHVLSYIPAMDGRDVFWCSGSRLKPGKPVRGGVPLCWPWFAKQNVLPSSAQHGFVRTLRWDVLEQTQETTGEVYLKLTPQAFPALSQDSSPWASECRPRLELWIGEQLRMRLSTQNDSAEVLTLTQALHSYFRVGDIHACRIESLVGKSYLDKLLDFAPATQIEPWQFKNSCDRIYLDTATSHRIIDPLWKREITVSSANSHSTVVWNPGAEGVKSFDDIPPSDWPQYLCLEVANCGPNDKISLAPGESFFIEQTLHAKPITVV